MTLHRLNTIKKNAEFLGILLLALFFSISSCTKDSQVVSTFDTELKYARYENGSYNMIWLPSSKSLSDMAYVKGFQMRLRSGGAKSNDLLPLNESIFAIEGVLNFEKCDATPTRVLEEDVFELTMEIESIDENGEVWIADSELVDIYAQVILHTEISIDEKISTIDLDVVDITSNSVQVRVFKTVSQKQQAPPPPLEWFDDNAQHNALGDDVIDDSYSANSCPTDVNITTGEVYMVPCHVGYPSQPWPSWVLINDELLKYYNLMSYSTNNGGEWVIGDRVWYTNLINPQTAGSIVTYDTKDLGIDCPYGRRDKVYMAGNFNSNYPGQILGGTGGCECESAPEPVFADFACGDYAFVSANLPDENVTGEQMNRYMQNSIDHIDGTVAYWASQGLPDAGVASIRYFGYALLTSNIGGISGPAHLRYHNCQYVIGTRNE